MRYILFKPVIVAFCLVSLAEASDNETDCVNIPRGARYCGVTKRWTSRIDVIEGRFAMNIPTLYAVAMLLIVIRLTFKGQFWRTIKEIYTRNKMLIYFKEEFGEDIYNHILNNISSPNEIQQIKGDKDSVYFNESYVCENQTSKEFNVSVSAHEVRRAQNYRKILWLRLDCAFLVLFRMSKHLIIEPGIAITWDVVDVFVDGYYFVQLERGFHWITDEITRNTHVNNAVMALAVMGAIKSTLLIYSYFIILRNNKKADQLHFDILMGLQITVCLKITFEDAPETMLEYFYVDKYITDNQPWWLLVKDAITFLIHTKPLVVLVFCGKSRKEYRFLTSKPEHGKAFVRYVYISSVLARIAFSITFATRMAGMMYQYRAQTILEQCLKVTAGGALIQTPFAVGCMNPFDWIVIVGMSVVMVVCIAVVPISFAFAIGSIGITRLLKLSASKKIPVLSDETMALLQMLYMLVRQMLLGQINPPLPPDKDNSDSNRIPYISTDVESKDAINQELYVVSPSLDSVKLSSPTTSTNTSAVRKVFLITKPSAEAVHNDDSENSRTRLNTNL